MKTNYNTCFGEVKCPRLDDIARLVAMSEALMDTVDAGAMAERDKLEADIRTKCTLYRDAYTLAQLEEQFD